MFISIAQVIISIVLIILILLQERSSGLSGVFGGSGENEFYAKRRGIERLVFFATIVLIIIFALLSLIKLIV